MITVKIWLGNLPVAVAFGGLLVASALRDADFFFPLNAIAGVIIASTSVGMFGRHLAMTGRKHRAVQTAASTTADPLPPVVYLRRFADDELLENANVVRRFIQLTTEEEQYARVLNRIGPFVAIGEFLVIRVNYMRASLAAPLAPHLQLTLRPVFEQLGAPWKKPSLSIVALVMVAVFITALAIFVVLIIEDFG